MEFLEGYSLGVGLLPGGRGVGEAREGATAGSTSYKTHATLYLSISYLSTSYKAHTVVCVLYVQLRFDAAMGIHPNCTNIKGKKHRAQPSNKGSQNNRS
jgi:hypothetical protein